MPETRKKWEILGYAVVAAAIALTAAAAVATALAIQDRKDDAITAEITRGESHLRELGAQIASIKDADLTSMNDFIAAYAQVEPLEKRIRSEIAEVHRAI